MSSLVITVKAARTDIAEYVRDADHEGALKLVEFFKKCVVGAEGAEIDVSYDSANPVAASATLTIASAVATDAITIGPVTLTASSTPADEDEFEIDGADDDADATALAAAINAHSVLGDIVVATVTDNVVTVTAKQKGVVGNAINISSADATITASAANLEGGTGGAIATAVTLNLGHT